MSSQQTSSPQIEPQHDQRENIPLLVLDLDGTLRYHKDDDPSGPLENFINTAQDVRIFEGVAETLTFWRENGYRLFAATNQAGVAFGYMSRAQCRRTIQRTIQLLEEEAGRRLFAGAQVSYAHPNAADDELRGHSLYRKPGYGMLVEIEKECREQGFIPDWPGSYYVGDREEDRDMAQAAGIEFRTAWGFFGREPYEGASDNIDRTHFNRTPSPNE